MTVTDISPINAHVRRALHTRSQEFQDREQPWARLQVSQHRTPPASAGTPVSNSRAPLASPSPGSTGSPAQQSCLRAGSLGGPARHTSWKPRLTGLRLPQGVRRLSTDTASFRARGCSGVCPHREGRVASPTRRTRFSTGVLKALDTTPN